MHERFDTFNRTQDEISDVPPERYGSQASASEFPAPHPVESPPSPLMRGEVSWDGPTEAEFAAPPETARSDLDIADDRRSVYGMYEKGSSLDLLDDRADHL